MQPLKCYLAIAFQFVFSLCLFSCKKFITVNSPIQYSHQPSELKTDSDANAAVVGIYEQLSRTGNGITSGQTSIGFLCGLSADELVNYSTDNSYAEFFSTNISVANVTNDLLWSNIYKVIYQCNSVLEGLTNNVSITPALSRQLQGEALFFRGLLFFYLVNLYGAAPLPVSTNYKTNDTLSRMGTTRVYEQIKTDLNRAVNLLPSNSFENGERIRAGKAAANALLSRVCLYTDDLQGCITNASAVIAQNSTFGLDGDLKEVFLKNSHEAILQFKPVLPGYNTEDAQIYILPRSPMLAALRQDFIKQYDTIDLRLKTWIGRYSIGGGTYFYPFKYKAKYGQGLSEYLMVLRLAELYLNRSEALAKLGFIDSATSDLNVIRARAGIRAYSSGTEPDILQAIYDERNRELFTEWGHRWLDLKRTHLCDSVMAGTKPGTWKSTAQLLPIPSQEILLNPHLYQNPGY